MEAQRARFLMSRPMKVTAEWWWWSCKTFWVGLKFGFGSFPHLAWVAVYWTLCWKGLMEMFSAESGRSKKHPSFGRSYTEVIRGASEPFACFW